MLSSKITKVLQGLFAIGVALWQSNAYALQPSWNAGRDGLFAQVHSKQFSQIWPTLTPNGIHIRIKTSNGASLSPLHARVIVHFEENGVEITRWIAHVECSDPLYGKGKETVSDYDIPNPKAKAIWDRTTRIWVQAFDDTRGPPRVIEFTVTIPLG